jgi:hypothetical protein
VIEDATTFRSKEQVLYDLSKALQFSPESLDANRKGRLSKEQAKKLWGRVIRPAALMFILAIAPSAIWIWITAGREQLSFVNAIPALFTELTHMNDLFEAHGKMNGMLMLGSIVASFASAAFLAFQVPWALYFDLLDRKVEAQQGRLTAREETTNRENGRDPIEKYYFSLRYLNMPVNLAAFRAIENGSIYIVYLTQRSEILVSVEPKMEDAENKVAADTKLDQSGGSTSPSKRAV